MVGAMFQLLYGYSIKVNIQITGHFTSSPLEWSSAAEGMKANTVAETRQLNTAVISVAAGAEEWLDIINKERP